MVASTNASQNGTLSSPVDGTANGVITNGTVNVENASKTLPKGKYTLVGIDIDTTGRRLIDEIFQLAAYTPKDHFEHYIMPYMNLNPAARQRHQVRVISIGFYRMLKSMQTYKIIKSKSEITVLKDFLDWLEALKAKDAASQGVILVYHEEHKFIPYMILESLKKYNLLDRFLNSVKSFANGLILAKANANESLQHYTLRKLSKVLSAKTQEINNNTEKSVDINNVSSSTATNDSQSPKKSLNNNNNNRGTPAHEPELFDGNASVRAKLAYEIALQLSNQENNVPIDSPEAYEKMLTEIKAYAQPIECDLIELQTQNANLERQNSFRPIFLNYFKTTLYHRVRAVKFRIILAEQGYDLQTLSAIWSEKRKEGLIEVLQVIEELKPEDKTELADLFDSFFDPEKTTIKPIVTNNNRRRNRRGVRNMKNDGSNSSRPYGEQGAGGDKYVTAGGLPDSTIKSPNGGSKSQRGKRNPRSRNNSLKTQPQSAVDTATVTATAAN